MIHHGRTSGDPTGSDLRARLDRRQLLRLFGAVAAVGAAGACTDEPLGTQMEQPSGRTITIGLISPALGPFAFIGNDIQRGFKLFLDQHANLLGRHRVDLRTAEEGATPEAAMAAVSDLLNQRVLALAGVANPASLAAIAAQVQEARVPLVASHAAPATLTTQLYIWRVSSVEGEAGMALAPYVRNEGDAAYVLAEDSATARAEAEAFRRAYTDLGGDIAGDAIGGPYASRLQAARTSGARAIFAACSGQDAADLIEAYRVSGLSIKLMGPPSLTETIDLSKLVALPNEVFTSGFYGPDLDNEANRRFVSNYHKAHGMQPTGFAMAGYDSASVLDKALRLVPGEPTPSALNQAFSLLGQIESPRGRWTFNQNRTPQQKWYLRRLRFDGQVPGNMIDTDLSVLS